MELAYTDLDSYVDSYIQGGPIIYTQMRWFVTNITLVNKQRLSGW